MKLILVLKNFKKMQKEKTAGLTLIELLVVLIILGILLAVAVPNVQTGLDTYRVKTATEEIESYIRYVQQVTITKERKHKIEFISPNYKLFEDESDEDEDEPEWKIIETRSTTSGIGFDVKDLNNNTLEFEKQGRPIEKGYLEITSNSAKKFTIIDNNGRVWVDTVQPD